MLAVLIQGGGTNGLQFTASQHWLEDRGCIDCTLGSSSTNQGVNLIDEGDDVTAGADLFGHLLEALLEVTAVARTSNQASHIQGVNLLAAKGLWHVVRNNRLSKTLNNRGLTNTWLTDQDWVVLGAARKNLHYALNLTLAANNRVQLALGSCLGEVATVLVQNLRALWLWVSLAANCDRLLALVAGK